jgi:hypothetical protein
MSRRYDEGLLPKCPRCGVNDAAEPHECPYDAEVNDDVPERRICRCCDNCALNHCQDSI